MNPTKFKYMGTTVYSIYYWNEGASSLVSDAVTPSLKCYWIIFLTYYGIHMPVINSNIRLLFCKVVYMKHNVLWLLGKMDFNKSKMHSS
jgi:hypothetical protein